MEDFFRYHSGTPDHPTPYHTTPKHDVGYPGGLEYMRKALQGSHVSTCGDATPLGSIGAIVIAIDSRSLRRGRHNGVTSGVAYFVWESRAQTSHSARLGVVWYGVG